MKILFILLFLVSCGSNDNPTVPESAYSIIGKSFALEVGGYSYIVTFDNATEYTYRALQNTDKYIHVRTGNYTINGNKLSFTAIADGCLDDTSSTWTLSDDKSYIYNNQAWFLDITSRFPLVLINISGYEEACFL